LDWIVLKCLEEDRNRRYETANGLAMDVRRYLNEEPVQSCPPSTRYRLRKVARKYRRPLQFAGGFLTLLVLGVIVSTWQAVRATSPRSRQWPNATGPRPASGWLAMRSTAYSCK
jgi:hypothetical protein